MGRKTNALALLLTAAAFALRLAYLLHSHPFIDEYASVLAAQAILQRGLPVLPSGLFYEHGLLFTYLDAPFVALAGQEIQFALVRLPSLLVGTLTVPLVYRAGRHWWTPRAGLLAAALFAFSPEGMVWGGRARMYALAQCLVLLLALLVYEGSRADLGRRPAPWGAQRALRWLALLTLLATLLTQFGALILVPPLLVGSLAVGWLTRPRGARPWFLSRAAWLEGVALGVVIGLAVFVKRLGRPVGAAPLGDESLGDMPGQLIGTITYQAGLALGGESAVEFLARQFGVPHHLWLTVIALLGGLLALVLWLRAGRAPGQYPLLYLWLVFGLAVVEMITLLEPWRRNPRYLVIALPLFYLIVAAGVERISNLQSPISHFTDHASRFTPYAVLVFVAVQAALLVPDLRIAYRTPEPAYEEALRFVASQWQAGDVLLTMNTSAAGLLGQARGIPTGAYRFAIQQDASQFLLDRETQPVDRWLGVPWVGTPAEFNRELNEHDRAWFVVDSIRLPVYYRGDWQAIVASQMDRAWSGDDALVYLTRPDRTPLPAGPDVSLDTRFGDVIALNGYSLAGLGDETARAQGETCHPAPAAPQSPERSEGREPGDGRDLCLVAGDDLRLTLFWRVLAPVNADYTIFVHLRDEGGATVAQRDSQPFDGLYPTSQWQSGETVVQPLELELPDDLDAGTFTLYLGLYRFDTMARLPVDKDVSGESAVVLDRSIVIVSGSASSATGEP